VVARRDATRSVDRRQEPRSANNGIPPLAVCRIWTIQQDCAVATNRSVFCVVAIIERGGIGRPVWRQTRLSVVAGRETIPAATQRTKNRTDNRRNN